MGILSNDTAATGAEEKVRVKVSLGEVTRRASAPLPTFAALYELTSTLFHSKDHLVFTYVDDMGDKITMSSDIELVEALRLSSCIPNQTLILVAVIQPKEEIVEAEDQAPVTKTEYEFFNQYTVPRGVFGTFSSIKDSEIDCANTFRVHQSTTGTFAPTDAKQLTGEVEIDLVAPAIAPCAPLSPLSTSVLTPILSVPTVAIATSSLPSLPLSTLPTLPVLIATPVVQKQPEPQSKSKSSQPQPPKQRRHAVFESSPLDGIDDLDLYRAHKEYKEKKRALKKKDSRKKELAKKYHRKSKDY